MRNKKGFTLLEVIISVAVISIISVYILQMFVAANRVNKKAYETDQANMLCMGALENFKASEIPPDGYEAFYDGDWRPVNFIADADYAFNVVIINTEPDMYNIRAAVTNLNGGEIASLKAVKYFAGDVFLTEGGG